MNKDNYNTIDLNANETVKRLIPKLELIKILHEYSTVKQKALLTIDQKDQKGVHTCRQKESVLDHIDNELFTKDDKLITHVQVIDADSAIDNISDITSCPKLKADFEQSFTQLVKGNKNKTRTKTTNIKCNETTRPKSVNISPLRLNENEISNRIMTSTIKHKEIRYKKPNLRVINISKFINKPKQLDKTTNDTSTSRSNSISLYKKNNSSAILNIARNSKLIHDTKRHLISFPSINARNNDKIIVDLQTMFGKNIEHLEGIDCYNCINI